MNVDLLSQQKQLDSDPFGLRKLNFRARIPEETEMFSEVEARTYIEGCDYPDSVDDLLLALEIVAQFGDIGTMSIFDAYTLDAMCGPGRLGRELLGLGAQRVAFHDGDEIMIQHAKQRALKQLQPGQNAHFIKSPVDKIPIPDSIFDLIVCHNSPHQLRDTERLRAMMGEFLRLTKPGGFVFIADYQRPDPSNQPQLIKVIAALEERLHWTKQAIRPMLISTIIAAFSKEEFAEVIRSISGVGSFSITDAELPFLTPAMQERVDKDPVKHFLDFSPISLRVVVQKEEI